MNYSTIIIYALIIVLTSLLHSTISYYDFAIILVIVTLDVRERLWIAFGVAVCHVDAVRALESLSLPLYERSASPILIVKLLYLIASLF